MEVHGAAVRASGQRGRSAPWPPKQIWLQLVEFGRSAATINAGDNSPMCAACAGERDMAARHQRAPFKVHDVVQVVVTPWSHFLQAATH